MKRIPSCNNLERMAELEIKIPQYRANCQEVHTSHWLHQYWKTRLDEAIIEYQERQLIQEQVLRYRKEKPKDD